MWLMRWWVKTVGYYPILIERLAPQRLAVFYVEKEMCNLHIWANTFIRLWLLLTDFSIFLNIFHNLYLRLHWAIFTMSDCLFQTGANIHIYSQFTILILYSISVCHKKDKIVDSSTLALLDSTLEKQTIVWSWLYSLGILRNWFFCFTKLFFNVLIDSYLWISG